MAIQAATDSKPLTTRGDCPCYGSSQAGLPANLEVMAELVGVCSYRTRVGAAR